MMKLPPAKRRRRQGRLPLPFGYDLNRLIVTSILLHFFLFVNATITTQSPIDQAHPSHTTPTTNKDTNNTLNIHIIPHTHDDAGWLKTFLQYYHGRNHTITPAGVKYILTTTLLQALPQNPSRTFTYVETSFFSQFYNTLTPSEKSTIKQLVASNQLHFANGGWVMHDEATTHYVGMMDQTTLGHDYLLKELNYTPKVGWQLDPFGHSATQASLFTRGVGFDAVYFGRIDYRDREARKATRECEGVWAPEGGGGEEGVFWGLTGSYGGNYGAPPGFCFEPYMCEDDVVDESNKEMRGEEFVRLAVEQGVRTKGNHIMMTMGSDFQYENAIVNYNSLDTLLTTLQNTTYPPSLLSPYTSLNIFYSDPHTYTQSKTSLNWTSYHSDFFPYADGENAYWTGYFTSRSGLKRFERVGSGILQTCRQIDALWSSDEVSGKQLRQLEEAHALLQHHDGVSGTSKQHVAYDYAEMLSGGINEALDYITNVLGETMTLQPNDDEKDSGLEYCLTLNETVCDVTQSATAAHSDKQPISMIIYNPLAVTREDVLYIPVSSDGYYTITNPSTNTTICSPCDLFSYDNHAKASNAAPYRLYYPTGVIPPLGMVILRLEWRTGESTVIQPKLWSDLITDAKVVVVENDKVRLHVNKDTGRISHVKSGGSTDMMEFEQEWGYYTSFDSKIHHHETTTHETTPLLAPNPVHEHTRPRNKKLSQEQNSGAYIFRPSQANQRLTILHPIQESIMVYEGQYVKEIRSVMEKKYVSQVTRLVDGKDYFDVEWTVGPVPLYDDNNHQHHPLGKEIITRYSTLMSSNVTFYTDSNGRAFLPRIRNHRPTFNLTKNDTQFIAGNYYPITTAIYLNDTQNYLSILTDRSQGASSLDDGSLEVMVQRRLFVDDARGVGEALNETQDGIDAYPPHGKAGRRGDGVIVSGVQRVLLGKGGGASAARKEMDGLFLPLMTLFYNGEVRGVGVGGLDETLPRNVMLVTFKRVENDIFLIRLAHQYGPHEDDELSKPVSVNLKETFRSLYNLTFCQEMTLTGNRDVRDWKRERIEWQTITSTTAEESKENGTIHDEECDMTSIWLNPLEIRTFRVEMTRVEKDDDVEKEIEGMVKMIEAAGGIVEKVQ